MGLSAGAVHRYFTGKDDLIAAITGEAFADIRGAFEEATRTTAPLTPDVLLSRVLGGLFEGAVHGLERRTVASLIVQVGSETLRDERLAALLEEGYAGTRIVWGRLVEAHRDAGILPPGVRDAPAARTVIAMARGFIVQEALFDDVQRDVPGNGLRGLMSMGPQKAS